MTPIGLSFFQAEWDQSVRNVFHDYLSKHLFVSFELWKFIYRVVFFSEDLKEPVYEFDFEKKFLPAFEKYPKNQPFNW